MSESSNVPFGNMDAITYVFGDTSNYELFMDLYFQGEVQELEEPQVEAIALYFDNDDNVIHVGEVEETLSGLLVVRSIIVGRTTPFLTSTADFPLEEIVRVSWIEPFRP